MTKAAVLGFALTTTLVIVSLVGLSASRSLRRLTMAFALVSEALPHPEQ